MQRKGIILPLLLLLQLVGSLVSKSSVVAAAFTLGVTGRGRGSLHSRHEMTKFRYGADPATETKHDNDGNADNSDHPPMVIVFGRPGAGKTTVAERAAALLLEQCHDRKSSSNIQNDHENDDFNANNDHDNHVLALDLDVCVPQWMKDNFAMGLYPTLAQRLEFAELACVHVETKHQEHHHHQQQQSRRLVQQYGSGHDALTIPTTTIIVSFSFVNTDLRHAFRQRFPRAVWALVDTSEDEAQRRIEQREGHFYKGRRHLPHSLDYDETTEMDNTSSTTSAITSTGTSTKDTAIQDENNADWEFAPVTFDHLILPGHESVERNAERVVDLVRTSLWK